MGAMSRTKGAAGERELCRLLSEELGITVQRNVDQARNGGADCLQIPGFSIECKRAQDLRRPTWWAQAVEQGRKAGAEPVVFYRRNREPWRAMLRTLNGGFRLATWDEAMAHIRDKLARLHAVYPEAA